MSKILEIYSCPTAIDISALGGSRSFPEWFAVYTSPRHEKKVREQLLIRDVESFLPLYKSARKWKNGCNAVVDLPLFPNYVFVRLDRRERVRVLEVPGVISFVSVGNKPAPLPEFEIETLRASVESLKCEPHPYLVVGERVRVTNGAMTGFEGILTRKKGGIRVVVSLELIMKSMAIEIDAADIEPIQVSRCCGGKS